MTVSNAGSEIVNLHQLLPLLLSFVGGVYYIVVGQRWDSSLRVIGLGIIVAWPKQPGNSCQCSNVAAKLLFFLNAISGSDCPSGFFHYPHPPHIYTPLPITICTVKHTWILLCIQAGMKQQGQWTQDIAVLLMDLLVARYHLVHGKGLVLAL